MRILLVSPSAPPGASGNRVTVDRWAGILRELGHGVEVRTGDHPGAATPDVLVALHARKSREAVLRFHRAREGAGGGGGLVVALTGTDLYRDLADPGSAAWEPVRRADRLVVLQERAPASLPDELRPKVRVIYQSVPELWEESGRWGSATADRSRAARPDEASRPPGLRVCMLAHLRPVKDPLLAARAARLLPAGSPIRIDHFGSAYSEEPARRARKASGEGSPYRWHGEIPRSRALDELLRSDLLLLTSRLEGAGNAASEAITARVPILCTRVEGLVGMVGADYPGLFAPGDARGLAGLLERATEAPGFRARLRRAVEARRPLLDPAREREAWAELLGELAGV